MDFPAGGSLLSELQSDYVVSLAIFLVADSLVYKYFQLPLFTTACLKLS